MYTYTTTGWKIEISWTNCEIVAIANFTHTYNIIYILAYEYS